jgi:hypothetical protein
MAMFPKTSVAFDGMPPISQSSASRADISRRSTGFPFVSVTRFLEGSRQEETKFVVAIRSLYAIWHTVVHVDYSSLQ